MQAILNHLVNKMKFFQFLGCFFEHFTVVISFLCKRKQMITLVFGKNVKKAIKLVKFFVNQNCTKIAHAFYVKLTKLNPRNREWQLSNDCEDMINMSMKMKKDNKRNNNFKIYFCTFK